MASPQLDDQVVLQHDIPELSLRSGDVGVVRGSVSEPTLAYEVEFRPGLGPTTLALLTAADLEVRPSTRGEKDQTNPGAQAPPAAEPAPGFVRCRRCGAETADSTAGLCPSCLVIAAAAALPGSSITDPDGRLVKQQRPGGVTLWAGLERPEKIGPYRILETIGEGSMGIVYKAEQRQPVRRLVALKVVKLGMDTKEVIARFEAERQALAMMNHPNVARVYDAGVSDRGTPYFVMEYVPGEPITSYCDLHRLPIDQRLRLFTQACDAVQHAHHKAIIHRDIKPSNVLVTEQDGESSIKVIDFGIAKALNQRLTDHTVYTEQGRLMGTPEYMSPEQAEQSAIDVDTRTDVYSLGVLLYELLAGALPFDSKMLRVGGHEGLRRIIRQQEPQNPSDRISQGDDQAKLSAQLRCTDCQGLSRALRRELEWIPLKAIRKDRAERYGSASQLADDVDNYLQGRPLLAGPVTRAYRVRKFVRQHSAAVAAGLVTFAVILGLVIALALTTRSALRASASGARDKQAADAARQIAEQRAREVDQERSKAKAATQLADLRLADELLYAGDSLTKSSQLGGARRCYAEALDIYRGLGTPPTAALAGMMAAGGDETPLMGAYGAKAGVGGFAGHTGNVDLVALTRDGRRAVTAAEDHTLILWDVATGAMIRKFTGHTDGVTYVALSPDQRTMLSASDDQTLIWWNLETGSKIRQLEGHTNQVWVVAFSPDGLFAASGGMDRTIRVWDLSNGKCVVLKAGPVDDDDPKQARIDGRNPDGHKGAVAALVFLPDGKRLLSGSHDSKMKLWNIEEQRVLTTYEGHTDRVNCIALAPDGAHAVTGSFDGNLLLWDLAKPKPIEPPFVGHNGWVWRVAFSLDGRQIVSAGHDGTARIWDVATRKELRTIRAQTENVMAAVFSTDGQTLLTTRGPSMGNDWPQNEGTMDLWDLTPSNGILGAASLSSAVTCVSISDDRTVLFGTADGAAMLWDATTHLKLRTFTAHRRGVRAVSLSRDGKWGFTAGNDGMAALWDMASGTQTRLFQGHVGPVTAVAFLPDGLHVLTGGQDATLRLWDRQTGDQLSVFPPQTSAVTSLSVSPDGSRALTGGADGTVSLWTLSTGAVRQLPGHDVADGAVNCVSFSPSGDTALSGGDDHLIILRDLKTDHTISFPKQSDRVTQVAFSPDGVTALSGTADAGLTLWDVKRATPIQSFAKHGDAITGLAFTTDGRCAVSSSQDKTVRLWDFGRALQYREFEIRVPQDRDVLAKSRNNAEALRTFGEWYAFRGKDDWAVEFLTKARDQGAAVSPLTLARCYCRLNDAGAARTEFRKAIKQEQISELHALLCLQAMSPTTRPSR